MKFACILLVGCAYSLEEYLPDYTTEFCQWEERCEIGWFSAEERCQDAFRLQADALVAGCTYSAPDARRCVGDLRSMECPAQGEDPAFPQSCEDAFVDCPVPVPEEDS